MISNVSIFLSCKSVMISSENYCINNDKEAIIFADSIWRNTYGNKIDENKPFEAKKINDSIWVVEGLLNSQKGGVPYAEINAKTCEIINMTHGK